MRIKESLLATAAVALTSSVVCTCVAPALAAPRSAASAAAISTSSDGLRGYLPSAVAPELAAERAVDAEPNAADALSFERGVASVVHRMGQPGDYQTAVYMRDQLRSFGWDAKIVTYVVPIAWPVDQHLYVTAPSRHEIDLYEPAISGDPWSADHAAIGKPYSGYSADGDVSGPLIYAGRATAADLALLAKMHVSLRGAIVLAKMGGGRNVGKALRLGRLGAKALLVYPEPGYDPYFPQFHSNKIYPAGPGRPLGGALRNSMIVNEAGGDPTAIGIPVPGAKHKPFSTLAAPEVPTMTVTALVAQQLAGELGGPLAPKPMQTKIFPGIRVVGVDRVRFVLRSRRFFGPIWNVVATMRGAVAPHETILVGGHRDAWTFGAIDPGSGSVAMLQMAKAFGRLHARGWRPYRTLVIASWDGEETNGFGSGVFADRYRRELLRNCWTYINTDEVATGATYTPGASDDLFGVMRSVADVATAPNGDTLARYWAKGDPKRVISPNGTGSDHESFLYHLNIPSLAFTYAGVFGTWHSAYDDIASLRVIDPGLRYADAAARDYGILTLRLADAPYPDLRFHEDALAVQRRLNAFANGRGDEARRIEVVRTLEPYVKQYLDVTESLDRAVDDAGTAGDLNQLRSLGRLAFRIRLAFYAPGGIPGHPWQGSVLYNSDDNISTLPSLDTTLDPKLGKAALDQLVAAFRKLPPMLFI